MTINAKLADAILNAMISPFGLARYETADGRIIKANRPGELNKLLCERGWKGVSRMDGYDYRELGFTVVQAQYVGGVRKTGKFCDVVTL